MNFVSLPTRAGSNVAIFVLADNYANVFPKVQQSLMKDLNYKEAINKHRRHQIFEIGDQVIVCLRKEKTSNKSSRQFKADALWTFSSFEEDQQQCLCDWLTWRHVHIQYIQCCRHFSLPSWCCSLWSLEDEFLSRRIKWCWTPAY